MTTEQAVVEAIRLLGAIRTHLIVIQVFVVAAIVTYLLRGRS